MEVIKKFNEIKTNIYKNTDTTYYQDLHTLSDFLNINDISLINIHNKNDVIADYEFKKEVLGLIFTIIDNGLIIKDKKLLNTIADLIIKDIPEINVDFCLQLEDLLKKIWILCIKILFYCGNIDDFPQIKRFISKEDIPDFRNICIALTFKFDTFRSYDLENLSKFSSFSVLYDVVKIYKKDRPEELKAKILINLYNSLTEEKYNQNDRFIEKLKISPNLYYDSKVKLTTKSIDFVYLIFYEVNFLYFPGLIKPPFDGIFSNEYMMLLYSLIINEETAFLAYKILQEHDVYVDMYNGINKLIFNMETEKQEVDPRDEKYLFFLLEVVVKILHKNNSEMIKITCMMFCDPLMKFSLCTNKHNEIIYEYLIYYCNDKETFLNITDFFKSKNFFTKENIINNMTLSATLIKFLWYINEELATDLAIYSLRSEDPKILSACFEIFEKINVDISGSLLLNSNYIRRAALKNTDFINLLINFQITKKVTLDDILLVNVIMSTENYKFFEYARLFKDFGRYMNDKFLERLIDNIEEGLKFIEECMTSNTVKFIKSNEKWFNLFLTNNNLYYPSIFRIYKKMISFDRNIEMSYEEGLLLLEVPDSSVFWILSHKIINIASFESENEKSYNFVSKPVPSKYLTDKEYKLDDSNILEYLTYLKTRLLVGNNIDSLIKFVINDYYNSNTTFINDLLGYYKLITGVNLDIKNESILCTYDVQNTDLFIRKYSRATDYEKIFLFMKIDDKLTNDEESKIIKIIKEEITGSCTNKLIYRQCLTTLLRLNNIDAIVRLIDDYEDKNLLLKINIRNLMTGGLYFNPKCINVGDKELQIYAISLLYFKNIWDINAIRQWLLSIYKDCRDNEEIRYIVDDIYKKHDIEMY